MSKELLTIAVKPPSPTVKEEARKIRMRKGLILWELIPNATPPLRAIYSGFTPPTKVDVLCKFAKSNG